MPTTDPATWLQGIRDRLWKIEEWYTEGKQVRGQTQVLLRFANLVVVGASPDVLAIQRKFTTFLINLRGRELTQQEAKQWGNEFQTLRLKEKL